MSIIRGVRRGNEDEKMNFVMGMMTAVNYAMLLWNCQTYQRHSLSRFFLMGGCVTTRTRFDTPTYF